MNMTSNVFSERKQWVFSSVFAGHIIAAKECSDLKNGLKRNFEIRLLLDELGNVGCWKLLEPISLIGLGNFNNLYRKKQGNKDSILCSRVKRSLNR